MRKAFWFGLARGRKDYAFHSKTLALSSEKKNLTDTRKVEKLKL